MSKETNARLIVGLDVSREKSITLSKELPDGVMVKVGLKLFNLCGPEIIKMIVAMGRDIFLDLKYSDNFPGGIKSANDLPATSDSLYPNNSSEEGLR